MQEQPIPLESLLFKSFILPFVLLTSLLMSAQVKSKDVVTLWSYYDYPPFVISVADKKGLNFDFVEMLNLFEIDSPYEYVLKMVPRKRLDAYLKTNEKGAVLWVNPIFFADEKQEKYDC